MGLHLRPAVPDDAESLGRICFAAFQRIAEQHGYPCDFPNAETAIAMMRLRVRQEGVYGVVADAGGRIVGSSFMDELATIAMIGPVTVDPETSAQSVGSAMIEHLLDRAAERGFAGTRLVQSAYNTRSLALYSKQGFVVREPLAVLQGTLSPAARGAEIQPPRTVREATIADLSTCDELYQAVHGFSRRKELDVAASQGQAVVVEHNGTISGYTTTVGFFGFSVGRTNEDLKALISAANGFPGPGFLVPLRNAELLPWCLKHDLRVVQVMTLMSTGFYREPTGAWLPSIHA